jgi:hypothetical protein
VSRRFLHYSCGHWVRKIVAEGGTLRPNAKAGVQPQVAAKARSLGIAEDVIEMAAWAYPVVWVTDVDVNSQRDAQLIGLGQLAGMDVTDCFRVEYRFIVPNVGLHPWKEWADANSPPERAVYRALLESADEADPDRWWVSDKPLTGCRLDLRYHAVREEAST